MHPPDLYAEIARLSSEGRAFVLATVIDSAGSTPQKPGSKMIVLPDGSVRGTVGGGAIELQIVEAAKALFDAEESSRVLETHLTHDLGMCCGGRMKVFLERHSASAKLWVFGAGHVAQELAGGDDCYFCITTHDHPLDQAVLEVLLPRPSAYVGVIGSRRKAERFKQRLLAAGFSAEQLERVRSPMGVPIHALTPQEIAVSIVGELIQARRRPRS